MKQYFILIICLLTNYILFDLQSLNIYLKFIFIVFANNQSKRYHLKRIHLSNMSFMLPFKLQINAPLSGVLVKQKQPIHHNKQLAFTINRIYRQKIKNAFMTIKNNPLQSPDNYLKFVLASFKLAKKQTKISYLPYHLQQIPTPPQIPKTPIFNLRVKSLKTMAFLKLKQFFIDIKKYQVSGVLQNRKTQLLNHLIPKIQQKIYTLGFRRIVEYSRQRKGRTKIIKLLDQLSNNIVKRVHYGQFLNKLRNYKSKQGKIKLGCQKIIKIIKLSQIYVLQSTFRKMELFVKYLDLQRKVTDKKERISKIYDMNVQRTVLIQRQRQVLRNLKLKLDQQSIQKNHVLTQKRRSLMLNRTKYNQQIKQLNEQFGILTAQIYKLTTISQKQSYILSILQNKRKHVKLLKRDGIQFQQLTLNLYKSIQQLCQQGSNRYLQVLKFYQSKIIQKLQQSNTQSINYFDLIDHIPQSRQYQSRRISLLQRIIKSYQTSDTYPSLHGSRVKPLTNSVSTSHLKGQSKISQSQIKVSQSQIKVSQSQLKMSPSGSSILKMSPSQTNIKGSRIISTNIASNYSGGNRSKIGNEAIQVQRLKQEYIGLMSIIGMVVKKSYEIKIKQEIAAQIQQLSSLLASDLKQNEQSHQK